MNRLNELLKKAEHSTFYRWLLNRLLWHMIPFNSPHRFKIISISDSSVIICMPYRTSNLNHIKGLHACGLATLCEYACGIQLMNVMKANDYRIIMKKMETEYLYQGKTNVFVHFDFDQSKAQELILNPLKNSESVDHTFEVHVSDEANNIICKAHITWQIKPWTKVKTKM